MKQVATNLRCSGLDTKQHSIASGVDDKTEDNEGSFRVHSIAEVAQDDHRAKRAAVRHNRKQLCIEIAKAEVVDESRQKNAD